MIKDAVDGIDIFTSIVVLASLAKLKVDGVIVRVFELVVLAQEKLIVIGLGFVLVTLY